MSKKLYFQDNIERFAFTDYEDYSEILEDYALYDDIDSYVQTYGMEISSITIYTFNTTLRGNSHFVYADATTKSSDWYAQTRSLAGAPYWSYTNDAVTMENHLTLSRVLYNKSLELVGIAYIELQQDRTETLISERSEDTMLLYNDVMLVHSNVEVNQTEEQGGDLVSQTLATVDQDSIYAILMEHKEDSFSGKVRYQNKNYLLSYERIYPDYSDNYYTVVSVQPYNDLVKSAIAGTATNLIPLALCIVIALSIISIFSNSITERIFLFKNQMHQAAEGDFDIVEEIGGNDEISELYRDLHVMIDDIQTLMESVVSEQVAKEQLNTRQREVEFKMLASQINPHFLYNTLETIRMQALVHKQPEVADLAKMLAKIMRHNIQVGESLQKVKDELLLIQYYLKIQDYRFHDRISYEILVNPEEIEYLKMMPLVIQPFVENAFAHGLEAKEADGRITIEVSVRTHLWIYVRDNGCGMSEEELAEVNRRLNDFEDIDRTHIGICNVNQRIKLKYGENYGVTIDSTEGQGTNVTIKLPLLTDL